MKSKHHQNTSDTNLSKHTESILSGENPSHLADTVNDIRELISELHTYQIELEMQNSELKKQQERVEVTAHQYKSLFEFSPIGLLITDERNLIVELNSSLEKILQIARSELVGKSFAQFATEDSKDVFHVHSYRVFNSDLPDSTEISLNLADNRCVVLKLSSQPYQYPNKKEKFIITAVEDITESKKHEADLQLTKSVFSHISEGVMITAPDGRIIDVNNAFTEITGYSRDETIGEMPNLMSPGTRGKEIYQHIWDELSQKGEWHGEVHNTNKSGQTYPVQLHIDAIRDSKGETQRYVALFADNAEQHANQQRLEKTAHHPEIDYHKSAQWFHEIIMRVRQALHDNELVLYYQPVMDMNTKRITGTEALLRWKHPDQGLLTATEFLSPIDQNVLTIDIGNWVINETLRQLNEWHQSGLKLTVSVIITSLQLEQENFIENLKASLKKYPDLPRYSLQLEILDTGTLRDIDRISDIVKACDEIGVSFSFEIDADSPLTDLKQLPVETLKINKSLAHGYGKPVLATDIEKWIN